MASFPTSVYSPAAVSPGGTIQAARTNNQDAEITAIEDGLRNGTAPLNSSNSTFNALSVTNGSTFGGAVTFAGPVSFSSGVASTVSFASSVTFVDINVTGTLTGGISPPTCMVTHSTDQNTVSGAWTGLNWDTEVSDPKAMHSTASNSSRITCVQSTGLYAIGANVTWAANTNGSRLMRILCNDSSAVTANTIQQFGSNIVGQAVSGLARVASTTDYFTVQIMQNTGSTLSVTNSTFYANSFYAYKVSS